MTRSPSHPGRAPQRGFALLLVLMLMFIAITVVTELAYQSNLELFAASNVKDLGMIEYAIDGQLEVALGNLRYDKRQNDIDTESDAWNGAEFRSRRDGDVAITTRVFDEQGKFNLMRLIEGNDAQKQRGKEILVRILDLFRDGISEDKRKGGDIDQSDAEEIAEKILQHLKREGASGQVPKPKTTPADTPLLLDQLLFVDTKDNRLMSVLLNDLQMKDGVAPGLHRYVTVYGTKKINLNTAPLVVLQALFPMATDRDYAQGIIDRRRSSPSDSNTSGTPAMSSNNGTTGGTTTNGATQGNPFTDVNQVIDGSVNGLTTEVIQRNAIDLAVEFDVKSDFFGIRIQGATTRTQRDELFVVERVKTDGFRFLLHQERTDPILETQDDQMSSGS